MLDIQLHPDNPLRLSIDAAGRAASTDVAQSFLVRFPNRLSDPVFLNVVESHGTNAFTLRDERETVRLEGELVRTDAGATWKVRVTADEPIWMLEWRCGGLDLESVIVPALGGQELTSEMPSDVGTVTYKYPFWWNAQFAIGTFAGEGGMWLHTKEGAPKFKLLRVGKPDAFSLGLGFEADAPFEETSLEAMWSLDGFDGAWTKPVDIHRNWLEQTFALKEWKDHTRCPEWMRSVNFILEIWGMSKERPDPLHTFDEMIERVREFAEHHDPTKTLLYLPGFAEEGIDSNAPDYDPAPKCGGREGFARLTSVAHELGYRVMIHTNVLALAYSHPLYESFKEYQVVDGFGQRLGWANDIDGDWLTEPFFAYMNPAYTEWGDHMQGVLGELIETFELDGVFLDQTLLAFNTQPNFMEGMRKHVERLQAAYPDVLFAGEGLHEQMLPALPVAQIHGIDSIAGVHGMEGALEWRRVHPVSAYLFGKYTRLTAHLLTKHPSSPTFERQEEAYSDLGVMPALVLYDKAQPIDVPALRGMIERANRFDAESIHRASPKTRSTSSEPSGAKEREVEKR